MTNPHVQDEVYRVIGEEVSRKEFFPGPMARAVADARGNNDLIQSLYIQFRYEQLVREIRNGTAPAELRDAAEAHLRWIEIQKGILKCSHCGHRGAAVRRARGDMLIFFSLLCIFVVPGLLYALAYHGYKGVCAKCGRTLIEPME